MDYTIDPSDYIKRRMTPDAKFANAALMLTRRAEESVECTSGETCASLSGVPFCCVMDTGYFHDSAGTTGNIITGDYVLADGRRGNLFLGPHPAPSGSETGAAVAATTPATSAGTAAGTAARTAAGTAAETAAENASPTTAATRGAAETGAGAATPTTGSGVTGAGTSSAGAAAAGTSSAKATGNVASNRNLSSAMGGLLALLSAALLY